MRIDIAEELIEMSEAHVLNVQREIQRLEANKREVDNQLEELKQYLTKSIEVINLAKTQSPEEEI